MSAAVDIAIALSLLVGGAFTLVGSYGLLKLDDPMKRLHAPTKASTLGVGALLLASMIVAFTERGGAMHEILVIAFLFVTAPVSAHFIAKVNIHRKRCETPPEPRADHTWATLDVSPAEAEAPKTP